jgi:chromosome segregation ATPase
MVKVTYRFDPLPFDSLDEKEEPDSKVAANGYVGVSSKDRDIDSLALKKADSMTEIFTHQIVSLQSDIKKLESQLSQQHERYDLLQSENDKLSRKSRQDEKLIASHANEIAELKERIATIESEKSAIQARNQILSDTVDDLRQEVKETKQKNSFFQEELSNKSQQLNSVRSLIEENNKVLATEKKQRHLHEQQISELRHNLTVYEEKNLRLTTANQALQEIVNDDQCMLMTCNKHIFHDKCGMDWIIKQARCPVCR